MEAIKKWRHMNFENCPTCGDEAECFTDSMEGLYYDSDAVRCMACHYPGWICCDEDTAYVAWCDEGYAVEAAERLDHYDHLFRRIRGLTRFKAKELAGEIRVAVDPTGDLVIYHQLMEIINE